jgi:DNA topoisomerase I
MNSFLRDCAPALTPKILRIYNASNVLQNELQKQQDQLAGLSVEEKIVLFNRANREVAITCNHVRSVPITWNPDPNIAVYEKKLADMRQAGTADPTTIMIAEAKIEQMKTKQKEREELSTVALGTSKILYIDPRICVAWCKNAQVDLSKIYSKSLRDKYHWAIEEIEDTPNFEF